MSRLNFPGVCLQDGPAGVSGIEFVNDYPPGISAEASFNRDSRDPACFAKMATGEAAMQVTQNTVVALM